MVDLGTNMLDNRGGDNMVGHGVDRGDSMATSNSWGSIGSNWGNNRGFNLKSGNLNSLDSGNLNSSSGSREDTSISKTKTMDTSISKTKTSISGTNEGSISISC